MFGYIFTSKINGFYVTRMMGFNKVTIFDFEIINHKLSTLISETTFAEFDVNLYITSQTYYILKQRDCDQPNYVINQVMKDISRFEDAQQQMQKVIYTI